MFVSRFENKQCVVNHHSSVLSCYIAGVCLFDTKVWKHIVWVVSNWHLIQVMLTAWSNSINTQCESICPCVPLSVCLPHPSGQYLFQIEWNSQKIFQFNPLHTGCIHWFSESSVMNWFLIMITKFQASGGRLNKKDGLARYGNSHVKDKTS